MEMELERLISLSAGVIGGRPREDFEPMTAEENAAWDNMAAEVADLRTRRITPTTRSDA